TPAVSPPPHSAARRRETGASTSSAAQQARRRTPRRHTTKPPDNTRQPPSRRRTRFHHTPKTPTQGDMYHIFSCDTAHHRPWPIPRGKPRNRWSVTIPPLNPQLAVSFYFSDLPIEQFALPGPRVFTVLCR